MHAQYYFVGKQCIPFMNCVGAAATTTECYASEQKRTNYSTSHMATYVLDDLIYFSDFKTVSQKQFHWSRSRQAIKQESSRCCRQIEFAYAVLYVTSNDVIRYFGYTEDGNISEKYSCGEMDGWLNCEDHWSGTAISTIVILLIFLMWHESLVPEPRSDDFPRTLSILNDITTFWQNVCPYGRMYWPICYVFSYICWASVNHVLLVTWSVI